MVFDLLRKFTLAGIGVLSFTREKAEQLAKELVDKGHASTEEARRFVDELVARGEKEREELRSRIGSAIKKHRDEWDLARRSDVVDLQERVRRLEERVFGVSPGAPEDSPPA